MPANLPFPLESGTILHFRSFGLKVNNYTPPSQRYWRIDKELGRGNLPVYRATPLRLESETESDLEVDPDEELSEGDLDFGKRKRTETSESEKAAELLAIIKAPTTGRNARGRTTKKVKGKSSTIVRVPISSTASVKTVKAPSITSNTLSDSGQDLYALIEPPHTTSSRRSSPSTYACRSPPCCLFRRRGTFLTDFR